MKKKYKLMIGMLFLIGITILLVLVNVKIKQEEVAQEVEINIIKDEVILEYGTHHSLQVKDYVNTKGDVKESELHLDTSKLEYELDKRYLKIGTHTIVVEYNDEKYSIKIVIEDKKAPSFISFQNEVEIENGFTGDISQYFKAEDLQVVSIQVDTSQVDFTKAGSYVVDVIASDASGNQAVKQATIIVQEAPIVEVVQPTYTPQINEPVNQDVATPLGQAIANAALSQVGNKGTWYGPYSCINVVLNSLELAGIDSSECGRIYDGYGDPSKQMPSLQIGDIVMYTTTGGIYHCAVYIGNGQAVHGGFMEDINQPDQISVVVQSYDIGRATAVEIYRFH